MLALCWMLLFFEFTKASLYTHKNLQVKILNIEISFKHKKYWNFKKI